MSITSVKHCDCCGRPMLADYAKFIMPARPEPVPGAPLIITPFHEDPQQPYQMVRRIYDVCEVCAPLIEGGMIRTVEQVRVRIDADARAKMAERLRGQHLVPYRDNSEG